MKVINDWLKQPEAYDKDFWQYNEFNINELAFHTHDGIQGDQLPPSSLTQLADTVTPATPEGIYYSATKTLPTGNTFDNTTISFFLNGERIYLGYEKVDDDNFKVISPYNTVTYEVRYA